MFCTTSRYSVSFQRIIIVIFALFLPFLAFCYCDFFVFALGEEGPLMPCRLNVKIIHPCFKRNNLNLTCTLLSSCCLCFGSRKPRWCTIPNLIINAIQPHFKIIYISLNHLTFICNAWFVFFLLSFNWFSYWCLCFERREKLVYFPFGIRQSTPFSLDSKNI